MQTISLMARRSLAAFGLGLMVLAVQAAPDAQAVLAASDAIRNPDKPFGVETTLIEYRNGNDLWFYDPSSQASIRISPQQRLLGQASNGDVVTVNLAKDYKARIENEETVLDGDRKERATYKLQLEAAAADVSYQRVELWVDRANQRPVKAQFYAHSGGLLKLAYYRRFESHLGAERPTETVIIDGLNPALVTVMRYAGFAWRDVPDEWLQRDYLPRFKQPQ